MKQFFRFWAVVFAGALLTVSCVQEDFEIMPGQAERTYFVYIAFNNNLSFYGPRNLAALQRGATRANMGNNNIVVYYAVSGEYPKLLLIKPGLNGQGQKVTLKTYDGTQRTATVAGMKQAIADMMELAPAQKYCMTISSHGMGWQDKSSPYTLLQRQRSLESAVPLTRTDGGIEAAVTRYVVQDGSDWMNMDMIVEALTPKVFDMVNFDACNMACVEVAHALRDATDYLVGSPTEVMGDGFPYERTISRIFRDDWDGMCWEYYNFYLNDYVLDTDNETYPYAQVACIDCSKMDELALAMRTVLKPKLNTVKTMSVAGIQYFDTRKTAYPQTVFDLGDFAAKLQAQGGISGSELNAINEALGGVVSGVYTTPQGIWGSKLNLYPINAWSGLTTFIPLAAFDTPRNGYNLNEAYFATSWGRAVYGD